MKKIILITIFLIFIVSVFTPVLAKTPTESLDEGIKQAQEEQARKAQEAQEVVKEAELKEALKQILPSERELIEQGTTGAKTSLPSGSFKYELIPAVIKIMLSFAGILAFIAFTVAGVMLVIAQGSEELIKKAKNIFLYSAIGLVIIATAYAIVYGLTIMLTTK